MPVYDYLCKRCGPFTEMRSMAESDRPRKCPGCGTKAPRAFLTAPYVASKAAQRRTAFANDERSASAPRSLKAHGGGCSCCSAGSMRYNKKRGESADAVKNFPSRGPRTISR